MPEFCNLREALDLVGRRLYGSAWTGEEAAARDPDLQIVGGWVPMGDNDHPVLTAPQHEQLVKKLEEIKKTTTPIPAGEKKLRDRRDEVRSKLEPLFQCGRVAIHMQCDNGARRDIFPTDWNAPGLPLQVNYASSIGEFQDGTVGILWVDRGQLEPCLSGIEPISMPRRVRKAITNAKHQKWVKLAHQIVREPGCPRWRKGRPNTSEIARSIRKRGKLTEDSETIRRYLNGHPESWRDDS